jgi:Protein of unknown function (DUF3592)
MSRHFRLPPPPRSVPFSLSVATAVGSIIPWLLLAFSSLFFWLFCARADLSLVTFRPPYAEAQGTVRAIKATGASESRQKIARVDYSYRVGGEALDGTSYVLGTAPEVGEQVTVEYLPDAPRKSRIAGMRRDLWSPGILLVALFPAGCLIVVIFNVRTGLRRCHLLRLGMLTTGKLIDKRRTSMTVNKQRVYELIFEFQSYDGRQFTTSARSHRTERLEDQREEPLLYDPLDPSRSVMIDSLPSRPELDEAGNLCGRPAPFVLFALLLPALVVAINLLLFANRLHMG